MRRASRQGALIAICFLALVGCTGDGPGTPAARTAGPSERTPPASRSLLYLKRSSLRSFNLESGRDRLVRRLRTADVFAAPHGGWLALVRDARPPGPGEEDFAARPRVGLWDPESGERVALGPGLSPLWDPSGARLAWLRPAGPRACEGESCSGLVEVMTLELSTMTKRVLAPPGRWALLSWSGDSVLVSDSSDLSRTLAIEPGDRRMLPIPPSDVWGASPDGDVLLRATAKGTEIVSLAAGRFGDGNPVSGLRGILAEGSWSPAGERLAAVELDPGGSGLPRSRIVLLSPSAATAETVPGSRGAAGAVLWSPAGDALAFARPAGPGGGRLKAVVCDLGSKSRCRGFFTWSQGVSLLSLT